MNRVKKISQAFILSLVLLTACSPWSLLFKRESYGELKSRTYSVQRINQDWNSLDNSDADLAYWSKKTGTIISINSICHPDREMPLTVMKESVLRTLEKPKIIEQKDGILANRKAIFTTVEGGVDGVPVKIKHVVVNKNFCTYDFIMSANPQEYNRDLQTFNTFVESFHAE